MLEMGQWAMPVPVSASSFNSLVLNGFHGHTRHHPQPTPWTPYRPEAVSRNVPKHNFSSSLVSHKCVWSRTPKSLARIADCRYNSSLAAERGTWGQGYHSHGIPVPVMVLLHCAPGIFHNLIHGLYHTIRWKSPSFLLKSILPLDANIRIPRRSDASNWASSRASARPPGIHSDGQNRWYTLFLKSSPIPTTEL